MHTNSHQYINFDIDKLADQVGSAMIDSPTPVSAAAEAAKEGIKDQAKEMAKEKAESIVRNSAETLSKYVQGNDNAKILKYVDSEVMEAVTEYPFSERKEAILEVVTQHNPNLQKEIPDRDKLKEVADKWFEIINANHLELKTIVTMLMFMLSPVKTVTAKISSDSLGDAGKTVSQGLHGSWKVIRDMDTIIDKADKMDSGVGKWLMKAFGVVMWPAQKLQKTGANVGVSALEKAEEMFGVKLTSDFNPDLITKEGIPMPEGVDKKTSLKVGLAILETVIMDIVVTKMLNAPTHGEDPDVDLAAIHTEKAVDKTIKSTN